MEFGFYCWNIHLPREKSTEAKQCRNEGTMEHTGGHKKAASPPHIGGSVVFARLHQRAPRRVRLTERPTDRPWYSDTLYVTIGRIYMRISTARCRLIIDESLFRALFVVYSWLSPVWPCRLCGCKPLLAINCLSHSNSTQNQNLKALGISSLERQRLERDLILCYNLFHGICEIHLPFKLGVQV